MNLLYFEQLAPLLSLHFYWMLLKKTEQAVIELCQAQSKLIQIGRVVRKKIEVGKKVWLEKYFGSKNFMGLKTL